MEIGTELGEPVRYELRLKDRHNHTASRVLAANGMARSQTFAPSCAFTGGDRSAVTRWRRHLGLRNTLTASRWLLRSVGPCWFTV